MYKAPLTYDPTRDALWERRFEELMAFKAAHGHCNVPQLYSENVKLGIWLNVQRRRKRGGMLPADRLARLDALGVVWEPKAAKPALT
jgi:hypothetical protein